MKIYHLPDCQGKDKWPNLKKWAKDINRKLTGYQIQMVTDYEEMYRFMSSQGNTKKATLHYYLNPFKLPKISEWWYLLLVETRIFLFLVDMWIVLVFLERNLATSIKNKKMHVPFNSAVFSLGIYPREIKVPVHEDLYTKMLWQHSFLVAKDQT